MTTLTAPAPAAAPTVPPTSPLTQTVTLTVIGALSGCLGLAAVWHQLWTIGAALAATGSALFLAATLLGVSAGQVPHGA